MQFVMLLLVLSTLFVLAPGDGFCEERLSVKSKLANVRSGPGIANDVLWQIEKYHPLLLLERKSGWVKFKDFENDVGWLHESLVNSVQSVITIKYN